ncbi:MAG: hypothetical protein ACFCUR_18390 [Rhodomicrobiaceae bacterium]
MAIPNMAVARIASQGRANMADFAEGWKMVDMISGGRACLRDDIIGGLKRTPESDVPQWQG